MPNNSRHRIVGTLACASCATAWDANYLFTLKQRDCLYANGFAHVVLPHGGLAINYCPECDQDPPPTVFMEVASWTSLSPLLS